MRGIFGPKAEKVTPGCKRWTANSHKISDIQSLLLGLSRQRKMVWARYVARVGEVGCTVHTRKSLTNIISNLIVSPCILIY